MKAFFSNHKFMLLCLLLLWISTLFISLITFEVNINDFFQLVIFMLNPLLFLFSVFSLGLFFRERFQPFYFILLSLILTSLLYANVVYYREFTDIITLPMLMMSSNAGDLSTSIFALINWYDVVYYFAALIISVLAYTRPQSLTINRITFQKAKPAVITLLVMLTVTFGQMRTLDEAYSFDRNHLIQTLGLYNFYIYDSLLHTQTTAQPALSEEEDWNNIKKHLNNGEVPPATHMTGIAEDMNVIVVSLESVESFVIGETLHGEEITPFLNELINNSYYFDNFYYQTGQGKTSDAEFIINNSLHPLGRGAVFLTHYDNEFYALPEILNSNGYTTAVFHANDETFYNRDIMYPNLGYENYYSFSDYKISLHNSVGWGMKDIDFVEQSMDYLTELPEPFYTTMITLTNHFPYDLDEEDHFIEPFDSDSSIVNQYFPTVRYTDEAMRILVNNLKEAGLYENTIIVMYGDHYGIANSHYEELRKFLGREIDLYESVKLERVPLIIHIPGMEGEKISTVSGQIDVMPTLLNILGQPDEGQAMFGTDLFAEEREGYAVLRDGSVVTDELIFSNETCLSYADGSEFAPEICEDIREQGFNDLYYSDKIIYGDLFRFLSQ